MVKEAADDPLLAALHRLGDVFHVVHCLFYRDTSRLEDKLQRVVEAVFFFNIFLFQVMEPSSDVTSERRGANLGTNATRNV